MNCIDVGTRLDKLKTQYVGPVWLDGYPWMRMDVDEAVEKGYIKPSSDMRMEP